MHLVQYKELHDLAKINKIPVSAMQDLYQIFHLDL